MELNTVCTNASISPEIKQNISVNIIPEIDQK